MAKDKKNLNEIKVDSTTNTKGVILEKSLPVSSAPIELKPDSGKLSAPVQSAPKDIKAQTDTTKSSGNKK